MVLTLFYKNVQTLIDRINRRTNINVTQELIIQLILYMYRSTYSRQSMYRLAVVILNYNARNHNLDFLISLLRGKNLLGLYLRQENIKQQPNYIVNIKKLNLLNNCNIFKLLSLKLFTCYQNVVLDEKIKDQQETLITNYSKFMRRYLSYSQQKRRILLVKQWKFDKELIDNVQKKLSELDNKTIRQQVIDTLYEEQLDNRQIHYKHNSYQLIQYLLTRTDKMFTEEFESKNEQNVNMLIKLVQAYDIKNLNQLKMKVRITKHVEYSYIYFEFSSNFILEDISNDIIINFLDNIENRLQIFGGSVFGYSPYVIIRRISDNMIMKHTLSYNNKQQIESLFQQCNDENIYDVIIVSEDKYQSIQNIRMRYLSYFNQFNNNNYELTLKHQQDLVSLSTENVKISNIGQCTNLRNLYSARNSYKSEDIIHLRNLRRIYSVCDEYQENESLLQDLFKNNELEYVYVRNYRSNETVVNSFTIKNTIQNLRFMHVYDEKGVYDIKLDASVIVPENLRVFDVHTRKGDSHKYGTIEGDLSKVEQIKQRLIHQINKNV